MNGAMIAAFSIRAGAEKMLRNSKSLADPVRVQYGGASGPSLLLSPAPVVLADIGGWRVCAGAASTGDLDGDAYLSDCGLTDENGQAYMVWVCEAGWLLRDLYADRDGLLRFLEVLAVDPPAGLLEAARALPALPSGALVRNLPNGADNG